MKERKLVMVVACEERETTTKIKKIYKNSKNRLLY